LDPSVLSSALPWVGFFAVMGILLALDLGVFGRREETVSMRSALARTAAWVALAFAFAGSVWWWKGPQAAQEFVAAYLIEESLSVDNIFVFVLIFTGLGILPRHQHKVLFWGIIGAVVMRALFIVAGVRLITQFHWVIYVFGAFLLFTAFKMWNDAGIEIDLETSPAVKLLRRLMPVATDDTGHAFVIVRDGVRMATPLLLALVAIESADLIFAVDSIPAVLAVSRDPFIVLTSNIFAIMGLRSLYFAVAGCMERFHYLHYGLSLVLGFVGLKMLLVDLVHIPIPVALGVVAAIVGGSIAVSWWATRGRACPVEPEPGPKPSELASEQE
jgi:tellurite resistance protein TerC